MNTQTDNESARVADVTVIGGGPAGSLCAAELSSLKYNVILIDPGKTEQRIEGLSARAAQLLHSKNMLNSLQCVSQQLPRSVEWGGLTSQANGEHLVYRSEFDYCLRQDAQVQGVTHLIGSVAKIHDISANGLKKISLTDKTQVWSSYVVDARGRRGQISNKFHTSPENIALGGFVEGASFNPGTLVKALDNGWLWLARKEFNEPLWVQLMFQKGAQPMGRSLIPEQLLDAVHKVLGEKNLKVSGETVARGADFRLNIAASEPEPFNPLRIGDASAAFDPLSGHGMFWAFSSALSAAAIINTLLQHHDSKTESLCRRFYQKRLSETYWRQARVGRDFYQLEQNRKTPFWDKRKNWPDHLPSHGVASQEFSFSKGPAIEAGKVVERELVKIPGEHGEVAWFGSIPLASTLKRIQSMAIKAKITPELLHQRCIPEVSRTEANQFWQWLQTRNLLDTSTYNERGT